MNVHVSRHGLLALVLCSLMPLAQAQKGMDQININGQFVLAARNGQTARVQTLLQEGAAVNSRDRNGDAPLNMAAAKGNAILVDILLKAGADANLANLAGVTPLMGAAYSNHGDIFKQLLAAGAQAAPLDRVKKNAATYAAASGCTPCLAELHRLGSPLKDPLENQLTLLMWAAAYGHEATTRFLLELGLDRTLKDNRGKTAADMARDGNHLGLARLLEQG